MKLGYIGLGKMGSRMVIKLLQEGHEVQVWNRSSEPVLLLKSQNPKVISAETIKDLVMNLQKPRILWCMLPAGEVTQNVLNELKLYVEKDDIVIDGGNAHFGDTQRRYTEFSEKGIRFLGIGVSGGILAEKNGYPLMVGGDKSAYEYIFPVLQSLSKPNGGYEYFGEGGAGHFVKMVHNAIEYGMMQAIGEGFGILEKSSYGFDLYKAAAIWQKGTIISGFLMDRAADALVKDPKLSDIQGIIQTTGEAEWAVNEAKKEQVPVEIIEKSLEFRKRSLNDLTIQESVAAKLIAEFRREFGGHEVVKK